jgi:hypothetical protein
VALRTALLEDRQADAIGNSVLMESRGSSLTFCRAAKPTLFRT